MIAFSVGDIYAHSHKVLGTCKYLNQYRAASLLSKDFELNGIFHPICHNWIVLFSFSAYNNQLDALE